VESAALPEKGPATTTAPATEGVVVRSLGEPPLGVHFGSWPHKLLQIADRPVLVVPAAR
jgi:hypothetical protein